MQSIRQHNIYANYIKKSFQLPQKINGDDDLWYTERITAEAINYTRFPVAGPVHINVPFTEPLYEFTNIDKLPAPKNIRCELAESKLSAEYLNELLSIYTISDKILIVVGLNNTSKLENVLQQLAESGRALVLTESCSNVRSNSFLPAIDRLIDTLSTEEKKALKPDLVITLGGMIVSKKIKTYLRAYKPKYHFSIKKDYKHQDTFKQLSHIIPADETYFLEQLNKAETDVNEVSKNYTQQFLVIDKIRIKRQNKYLKNIEFCDFKVIETALKHQPENSIIQWGNSTPVRYANLFGNIDVSIKNYANRGVGGIDGAVSTAAGFAYSVPEKIVTHVTGDLAFFYDSNALWNDYLPNNLRIILINNAGGNIFRIIPGPDKTEHLKTFFEHQHTQTAHKICEAFGVDYQAAENQEELDNCLSNFYEKSETAKLIEVKTNGEYSAQVLRNYFKVLRTDS
ncbi:UNVERIFIED_CONTAM: hypothetical protein GTU68_004976 [Idotea baltica]|nr:hypothetical protein [Idotea baltica]